MATKDLITEKETNNFSELGEAERGDRIEKLETERDDLIFKLELLMERSAKIKIGALKVDGGASANSLLMEFQADILGVNIERPSCVETTALGAAYLTGLSLGVYKSVSEIKKNRKIEKIFEPSMKPSTRKAKMKEWRDAVGRSLGWKK